MSQVTKPIALDETLQDVVTAIQGITQGGMIVSTGTVGSATQPVYINGGVPTAIQPEDAAGSFGFLTRGTNAVNIDDTAGNWTMAITPSSAQGTMPWTDYWAQITQFRSGAFCTQIATLIRYSSSDRPDRLAIRHKYVEAGSSYVWSSWKMVYGITTGTPTTSTNFTYDSSNSTVAKSGNVVQVRLKFTVSTAFTPTSNTVIATLPFKAFVNLTILPKALVVSGTAYRGGTVVIRNTNQITFDTDARALSVGDSVYIWGTYLTND